MIAPSRLVRAVPALMLCARVLAGQGTVRGTVFDSLRTNAPLRGATVVINERAGFATTDARGRFEFAEPVPAGKYTITFLHPILDSLFMAAGVLSIEVPKDGGVSVSFAIPSAKTLVQRVCRNAADTATGMIVGRVRDVDDSSAIASATVRTEWTELTFANGVQRQLRAAAATTDSSGRFVLCGVPSDIPVDVRASHDSSSTGGIPTSLDTALIQRRDFAIARRPHATGSIAGTVRSAQGRLTNGAQVGLFGTELSVTTNDKGEFTVLQAPAGTQAVEARQIGARPMTTTVDVPSGGFAHLDVRLDRSVTVLPRVSIVGRPPVVRDKDGFAERARQGMGTFFDEADLDKHGEWDLQTMLARAPGLSPRWGRNGRYFVGHSNFGTDCVPNYYVDGIQWYGVGDTGAPNPAAALPEIAKWYHVADFKGIEVYRSSVEAPARFDPGNSCGSIVLWTK